MTVVPDLSVEPVVTDAWSPVPLHIGGFGDPGTLLLSGPTATPEGEDLAGHSHRWGLLTDLDGSRVRALLRDSRLDGRGGGGFPLSRKVETARMSAGHAVVIVNASESEPASRKDRALCTQRPHLVLDGASLLARAPDVDEVVVHVHRGSASPSGALSLAVAIRRAARQPDPQWRVSDGPDRYVSGESSAVAGYVDGGEARPQFTDRPLAVAGPSGRPTVVSNAETVAQLAVLARIGPVACNALGAPSSPGPRLVTLAGAVTRPGRVLELTGPGTIGDLLAAGTFRRRGVRKMTALADTVLGSGACGHPDGAVRLIRSTVDVFEDDVIRHLAGSPCRGGAHPPILLVPDPAPGPRTDAGGGE